MTTDKAPVTVEQGDVDMARRFMREYHMGLADTDDLAKDFASARLQSAAALEEEIKRLRADIGEAERHLAYFAKRPTIAEVLEGKHDPMPDTVEDRIAEMGRRKREHDDAIMAARTFLARTALEGRGS